MCIVGIDISKAHLDACNIENRPQAVPGPVRTFAQTKAGYKALLKSIPDPASAIVVFESTGVYGRRMASALEGHVKMLCQLNPKVIASFSCSMNMSKTDAIDATKLAVVGGMLAREKYDILERQQLDMRPDRADLQLLLTRDAQLSDMIAQHGGTEDSISLHNSGMSKTELKHLKEELTWMNRRRRRLQKRIVKSARALNSQMFELLCSIPGIGELTAAALVEKIVDISQFPTAASLKGYFGLYPVLTESGKFKGRSYMARHGDTYIRRLIWNCAKSAAKHNPPCAALYQRLRQRNRHPASAWGAVASKLMCQIHGVLSSGKPFDRNYGASVEGGAKTVS
jgi:transposase